MTKYFALGERGVRPVRFATISSERAREVSYIFPGTVAKGRYIEATWDVAKFVAAELGQAPPVEPNVLTGLSSLDTETFEKLDLHNKLRPYQREGALFLALRSAALEGDEMRLGKTCTLIGGSVLAGAKRNLVIAPATVRRVWAREVAKFAQKKLLILTGRSATKGQYTCNCMLQGCAPCGYKGYYRIQDEELEEALKTAPWVFVNYDLVQPQFRRSIEGKMNEVEDLPGWGRILAGFEWDVVICDEGHRFRGFSTDSAKKGRTRLEYIRSMTESARHVWISTGTPIPTYMRDLWALLDIMTKGAASGNWKRLPFAWHVAYCDGKKGEYGWVSNGLSPRASEEIPHRLSYYMIRRTRKEVYPHLPKKQIEVWRLPPSMAVIKAGFKAMKGKGPRSERLQRALWTSTDAKIQAVAETVSEAVIGGAKVIVFTYRKLACAAFALKVRSLLKETDHKVFRADGEMSVEDRMIEVENFVQTPHASVLVATIDSISEGISAKGAAFVYFLELHHQPGSLAQAQDRAWDISTPGYSVIFCVMENAIDDRYISALLQKIEAQKIIGDDSMADFATLAKTTNQEEFFEHLLDDFMEGLAIEGGRSLDDELALLEEET